MKLLILSVCLNFLLVSNAQWRDYEDDVSAVENSDYLTVSSDVSTPPTTPFPTTSTSSVFSASDVNSTDILDSVSVQDILSSGIDESDKINKKIANILIETLSIDPKNDREILLTLDGFLFPKKIITSSSSRGNVTFFGMKLSTNGIDNGFTRTFACDVQRNSKIEIGLPRQIKITSNVTVVNALRDIKKEGSISITLENAVLLKPSKIARNNRNFIDNNLPITVAYSDSTVHMEMDKRFQTLVYQNLEIFLNETEPLLATFLATQLSNVLDERNITQLLTTCSRMLTKDQQRKILPFFNNYMNNVYVISSTNIVKWDPITLNAGPIVIEGLSNITNVEESTFYDYFRRAYPDKKFTTIISTGALRGKCELQYDFEEEINDKATIFDFTVESVKFHSHIYAYNGYEVSLGDVNVFLDKIQIKTTESNSCVHEKKFVNIILSKYLKSIIEKSLTTAFEEEVRTKLPSLRGYFYKRM